MLDTRAEAFGLFLHPNHQLIAVDPFRKTGIVFDDAGGSEEAAGHDAGEHQGVKIGARCVKRGG